jgi:hypothetical protein
VLRDLRKSNVDTVYSKVGQVRENADTFVVDLVSDGVPESQMSF